MSDSDSALKNDYPIFKTSPSIIKKLGWSDFLYWRGKSYTEWIQVLREAVNKLCVHFLRALWKHHDVELSNPSSVSHAIFWGKASLKLKVEGSRKL